MRGDERHWDSFPELSHAVVDLAEPGRIDIIRAKTHSLSPLAVGRPHSSDELLGAVAALFGVCAR